MARPVTDPNVLGRLTPRQQPPSTFGGPPLAEADTRSSIVNRGANTANTVVDTATAKEQLPYVGGQSRSNAIKSGAEAVSVVSQAARGGLSGEELGRALGRRAAALTLLRMTKEAEDMYKRDFRGGGLGQSIREYLPNMISPTNQNFDTKATMMFPLILGLVPKTDSNPATYVQQKFEQYVPRSGSFDPTNGTRFGEIRRLAQDAIRSTNAAANSVDPRFLNAVSTLVQDPSPLRQKQYDAVARKMGWATSAVVLSGLNTGLQQKGRLYVEGK